MNSIAMQISDGTEKHVQQETNDVTTGAHELSQLTAAGAACFMLVGHVAWRGDSFPDSGKLQFRHFNSGMTIVLQQTGFNRRAERSHSTG